MNSTSLTLAATLLVLACAGPAASAPNLDGRQFLSVDVSVNGAPLTLVPGTRIRISFDGTNIGASAGCNHLGGSYRLDGGRLVVGQLAMTEMGCDPARHDQDTWLSTFLGSQPQVHLAGADLVLETGETVVRLVDREVAEPDLPLTGVRWSLTTIIEGDAAMSVPVGVQATLELTADGNFSLHAGCNQGGGRYTLDGSTITFSDLVLTRMACDEPRAGVESAVLAVIGAGPLTVTVEANSLTLDAGGRSLGFSGGG
ncbi:MAG TPA: META domain-containing protein [Candidatus Limnocylindrales bacterium]